MFYNLYEMNNLMWAPANIAANAARNMLKHPLSPTNYTEGGRALAENIGAFANLTRRPILRPDFDITSVRLDNNVQVMIRQKTLERRPFCKLLHFERMVGDNPHRIQPSYELPRVLLVAPLSGHYSTLLRDTVKSLLKNHDVYVTDWNNAREVPLFFGGFSLDTYISYLIDYIHLLGPKLNVVGVSQSSVPALAASALVSAEKNSNYPQSVTLIGGPIDTRINPTKANKEIEKKSYDWFKKHIITSVPWIYPGAMRNVCPGFVMLSGFLNMNLERHLEAHINYFNHLIEGDEESIQAHKAFYDEFMAVMDTPAEYFLDALKVIYKEHSLPKGAMRYEGEKVNLKALEKTALLTIEGERDDISGLGQTKAAQGLCCNVPESKKQYYMQKGVGHFGLFNGKRWREEVMPQVRDFIQANASL